MMTREDRRKMVSASRDRLRARRRAANQCRECGTPLAVDDRTRCKACKRIHADHEKLRPGGQAR